MKSEFLHMKAINRGLFELSRSLVRIWPLSFCLLAALVSGWSIAIAQQPASALAPLFNANAKYVQGVGPGYWPTAGAGLTLNVAAGTALCGSPPAAVSYAGGTLTMVPSVTNYVYLDPSASCAPASNTSGFAAGQIPLAVVVTDASSITSVTDVRTWFIPQPISTDSGGGALVKSLNSIHFADSPQYQQGSSTGGIMEAIADFGDAPACGTVILPKGIISVSAMIDVNGRHGCHLIGHGSGQIDQGTAPTLLQWTGASGGTVLRVYSSKFCLFQDFAIDGNGLAAAGIDYTALNTVGVSLQNVFERIRVVGTTPSAIGVIHVGSPDDQQVSESSFRNVSVAVPTNGVGLYQDGGQTVSVRYQQMDFSGAWQYAMDFAAGSVDVNQSSFGRYSGGTTLADIRVQDAAEWVSLSSNEHEPDIATSAPAYLFPAGTGRAVWPTTFIGNRVQWLHAGGNVIDIEQNTALTMKGNAVNTSGIGSGTVYLEGQCGGTNPLFDVSANNFFESGVTLSAGGCAGIVADGAPGGGSIPGTNEGLTYKGLGLFLDDSGFGFGTGGAGPLYKLYLNSGQLRWTDGSNNILATQYGGLFSTDIVSATTGFRVNGAAPSGRYLKGNGTNFGISSGAASGTGSCTNQVVTATNSDAAPTCTTITSSYTSGSFPATAHNLLSSTHGDTASHTVARGDLIAGIGASPAWTAVTKGSTNSYPKWNSSGDVVASTNPASGTGACAAHNWASTLSADAAPTCTQPASSDLSDSSNVALYNNGSKTWGGGAAFTWTFNDGSSANPTLAFDGNGKPTLTAGGTNQPVALAPSGLAGVQGLRFSHPNSWLFDEFLTQANVSFGAIGSPSGNIGQIGDTGLADANHPGVMRLDCGTVSGAGEHGETSGVYAVNALNSGAAWFAETQLYQWDLATQRVRFGIGYNWASDPPANGYFFVYDSSIGGNWHAKTCNSSSCTDVDTGVAAVATTWTTLRVAFDGSYARFYINDALVASSNTNFHSGVEKPFWQVIALASSANHTTLWDYLSWYRNVSR